MPTIKRTYKYEAKVDIEYTEITRTTGRYVRDHHSSTSESESDSDVDDCDEEECATPSRINRKLKRRRVLSPPPSPPVATKSKKKRKFKRNARVDPDAIVLTPLRNLREAQLNYKTDELEEQEIDEKIQGSNYGLVWKPIINDHVAYEHLPPPCKDLIEPVYPKNSLYYCVKPMPPTQAAAVNSVTDHLVKELKVDYSDLPMVTAYTHRCVTGNSVKVLLQFNDPDVAMMVAENNQGKGFTIDIEPGGRVRTWKLKGSGARVEPEVFKATFELKTDSNKSDFPIKHEVACRVAARFAESCQASTSGVYDDDNGVLGLYREVSERKWPNGSKTSSDRNRWSLALWIPSEVDRSTFVDQIRDDVEGLDFKFDFCRIEARKHRSQKAFNRGHCCGGTSIDDWKKDHVELPYK